MGKSTLFIRWHLFRFRMTEKAWPKDQAFPFSGVPRKACLAVGRDLNLHETVPTGAILIRLACVFLSECFCAAERT